MAQLTVDIGGRPGHDCGGFCTYCYFKRVGEVEPFGCKYCLPFVKGCDYCSRSVREGYAGFRDIHDIADDVLAHLQMIDGDLERITISGGGDPSCYPRFRELVELLASMEAPLHIGYTSGKGFDDPSIADFLVENGLDEISFTVFSVNPGLRRAYMGDRTPEISLEVLERLCEAIDVYAASVVIPGVNDGEEMVRTCAWLEDRGAKGHILMRFANRTDQGLILGNAPIIPRQRVHTVREFRDLITGLNDRFSLKINGTPQWDPTIGSPFALASEPGLIAKLPRVQKKATIITGSIAAGPVQEILDACGNESWVIGTRKEIACLITAGDLEAIDAGELEETVIIPGRAFVHDEEAAKILSADGVERTVVRGPDMLTADAETSMGMSRNGVLELELEGFASLIRTINKFGR